MMGRVADRRAVGPQHDAGIDVPHSSGGAHQRHDQRRTSSRTAWLTVVLVAVLLVLAGGYFLLTTIADTPPVQETATAVVPDLTGMTEADATDLIVDAGLIPSTDEEYNATVDAGTVISTDPTAGSSVETGSRVDITVSLGPANVVLPDGIIGLTESSARDRLADLGLRGGEITEETSADVPEGRVITTMPGTGQTVPVGSAVDLVLSNGKVTVPLLTDLTLAQAQALLADPSVQLPSTVREVENSVVVPGIVTAQSSPARSEVDQGTEIVLTVAKAPVEEPAPEPSEEASQEPSQEASQEPSPQASRGPSEEADTRPTRGAGGRPSASPREDSD